MLVIKERSPGIKEENREVENKRLFKYINSIL